MPATTVAPTTLAPPECGFSEGRNTRSHADQDRTVLFARAEVSDPAPVVVLFHGFAADFEAFAANSGLLAEAPASGVHLVVPAGLGDIPTWELAAGPFDDAGFAQALIDDLRADPCVDPDRVWLAGYSAGAGFIGVLGCQVADRIAGLVMNAAVAPALCSDLAGFDVIVAHGTADLVVPFTGVEINGSTLPSSPELTAGWAAQLGCPEDFTETEAGLLTQQHWAGCGVEANTVDMLIYDGGGHRWPGRPLVGGEGLVAESPDLTCVLLAAAADSPDAAKACVAAPSS